MDNKLCVGLTLLMRCQADEALSAWITEGVKNNPSLEASHQIWKASQPAMAAARGLPDPIFEVNWMRTDSTRLTDSSTTEYSLSQALPWPGRRSLLEQAARRESEAAGFRYLEAIRKVRLDITSAAWDLWLAEQKLGIATERIRLADELARTTLARLEAGGGQADLLRAQMELTLASNDFQRLENQRSVAAAEINRLLNAPIQTPRAAGALMIPRLGGTLDEHLDRADDFCCTLIAYDRAWKAARLRERIAHLEGRPTFEIRVDARQPEGEWSIREYDTAIAMSLPWFGREKYRAAQQTAAADSSMAEADIKAEISMTLQDVKRMYTDAADAQRDLELLDASILPVSRQIAEVLLASYQQGDSPLFELIEARRMLQEKLLQKAEAASMFAKAVSKLWQTTGAYGPEELATGLVTEDNNLSALGAAP